MFSKFGACALLRYNRGACAVHQLQQRARQLSTKPQVAPGAVRRTLRFLYQNKQSLINIVAMYFVLSMALHQMRVKKAWDEREEEYEQLKATSSKVEANLTSDEWLHDIARQLKVDPSKLEAAIRERIEEAKPKKKEEDFDHLTNTADDGKDVKII